MQTRTTVCNSCSAMRESSRTFLRVTDTMDIRFVRKQMLSGRHSWRSTWPWRLSHVIPEGVFPSNNSLRLRTSETCLLLGCYGAVKPGGHDGELHQLRTRIDDEIDQRKATLRR